MFFSFSVPKLKVNTKINPYQQQNNHFKARYISDLKNNKANIGFFELTYYNIPKA